MRWHSFLAATAWLLLVAALAAAEEFPYVAYINSDDVYIRSGPSKDYYPTQKLRKGDPIEVYRHDPGGWCAIRPPDQSFSWVSARQLDSLGDGLASVNKDRAVARVGSAFSDVRDVIQVHLNQGEKVDVLETRGAWSKIAPPAGEFRWIYSKFIDRDAPAEGGLQLASNREQADREDSDESDEDSVQDQGSSRDDDDSSLPPRKQRPNTKLPKRHAREKNVRVAGGVSAQRAAGRPRDLDKELDNLNIELSTVVAEEVTVWSFEELRRRAEELLDLAQNSVERGRVRMIITRVDRFEEIKERHDAIASAQADTDRRNRALGADQPQKEEVARYDGVGRLHRVALRTANAPQFALLDAAGSIVCYVTPATGVNLTPYQDRQIGVHGTRSYLPDVSKQHVTVQRVTMLNGDGRTLR